MDLTQAKQEINYCLLTEQLNKFQTQTGQSRLTISVVKKAIKPLEPYYRFWQPDMAAYLLQVPQGLWEARQIKLDLLKWIFILGDKKSILRIARNNDHQKHIDNILGVIDHPALKSAGIRLNAQAYAETIFKRTQLAAQIPDTIVRNILGVPRHPDLKSAGITLDCQVYTNIGLKEPQLFLQSPNTIVGNILGVVRHPKLAEANILLDAQTYINVAIKQPALFTQSPDTIAEHIILISQIYQIFKKDFTISRVSPTRLCLAKNNLELRVLASALGYVAGVTPALQSSKTELRMAICKGFEGDGEKPNVIQQIRSNTLTQAEVAKFLLQARETKDERAIKRAQAVLHLAA